ncbi:HpcH/HpaI aldolase/citrate lyase family protein [Seohaeicola saemankumensis]|nr:HpcH/HpaI aldolase/citrate lyase family protein [Seohaeicola saemankumensis]MCA0870717.1 HpcH/HpaI aldolase/citrate lyase family protein [Seohaeicola saemankumensis]
MAAPENLFKTALRDSDTPLYGSWLSLANGPAAEMMGTAGFDWLLIDGEHAANDIPTIRDQLIALEASPSHAIVRVPVGETWIIKQVLDIGAQSVLVPMVESGEQARELVRACTYPPAGNRGVGAAATRCSRFGSVPDYVGTADAQISLHVQVESRAGVEALDDILAVEGLDGVFIGPADLAADMGHKGDSRVPEVHDTILDVLRRTKAAGKTAGILCLDERVPEYVEAGARFVGVAIDVVTMLRAARETAQRWK